MPVARTQSGDALLSHSRRTSDPRIPGFTRATVARAQCVRDNAATTASRRAQSVSVRTTTNSASACG